MRNIIQYFLLLQSCFEVFTLFNRRHHCRACGAVVCGSCSGQKAPLRYLLWEIERVCDKCFDILFEGLYTHTFSAAGQSIL